MVEDLRHPGGVLIGYIPRLLAMVASGVVNPETVLTQHESITDALSAYREFDPRSPGWLKTALQPSPAAA